MEISKRRYSELVSAKTPPSPIVKDIFSAFFSGGLICALGQLLLEAYVMLGIGEDDAKTLLSVTLIFIAAVLTGLGVFDKLAKRCGAGTLVPITGFANSVVSPAVEYKSEGQILGLGAKMFTIAGPVLVYGITASAIYGIVLWAIGMFM